MLSLLCSIPYPHVTFTIVDLAQDTTYSCILIIDYGFQPDNTRNCLSQDDHYSVCDSLKNLSNEKLMKLGTALGLLYPNVKKMKYLPEDMVYSWLNGEDNVLTTTGPPCWASLVTALNSINQGGIASTIKRGMGKM